MAAFNSMIHRLLNVPLSEKNFTSELNLIKQIALNNNYNPEIIANILVKKRYKLALKEIFPSTKSKDSYNTLTYIGEPSNKISKFFRNNEYKISFKTGNTLGRHIKNYKSKTSRLDKSGIYRLNCGNCPKFYIGRTYRNFKIRISEHERCFRNKKLESNYGRHLVETGHNFNSDFEILHVENKGLKLNMLESLEINKQRNTNNLLNDQLDLNNSPLLNIFNNRVQREFP